MSSPGGPKRKRSVGDVNGTESGGDPPQAMGGSCASEAPLFDSSEERVIAPKGEAPKY